MQFTVHMRDGASFRIEASYLEVVAAGESSYTFLGPVPGYPRAILASFPVELVSAVLPTSQADGAPPRTTVQPPARGGQQGATP